VRLRTFTVVRLECALHENDSLRPVVVEGRQRSGAETAPKSRWYGPLKPGVNAASSGPWNGSDGATPTVPARCSDTPTGPKRGSLAGGEDRRPPPASAAVDPFGEAAPVAPPRRRRAALRLARLALQGAANLHGALGTGRPSCPGDDLGTACRWTGDNRPWQRRRRRSGDDGQRRPQPIWDTHSLDEQR
jgi:hypothetical protein